VGRVVFGRDSDRKVASANALSVDIGTVIAIHVIRFDAFGAIGIVRVTNTFDYKIDASNVKIRFGLKGNLLTFANAQLRTIVTSTVRLNIGLLHRVARGVDQVNANNATIGCRLDTLNGTSVDQGLAR
jgi:hypothetical protein